MTPERRRAGRRIRRRRQALERLDRATETAAKQIRRYVKLLVHLGATTPGGDS